MHTLLACETHNPHHPICEYLCCVVLAKISHSSGKCIRIYTSPYHAVIEVESGLLDETVTKAIATFAVTIYVETDHDT